MRRLAESYSWLPALDGEFWVVFHAGRQQQSPDDHGESETATYRFDGKDSKNRLSTGGSIDGSYTFVSQWEGDSLVTKVTYRGTQGPRESTETISTNKDTLVIRTVRPSAIANGDPIVQTQTFIKKPE